MSKTKKRKSDTTKQDSKETDYFTFTTAHDGEEVQLFSVPITEENRNHVKALRKHGLTEKTAKYWQGEKEGTWKWEKFEKKLDASLNTCY